MSFLNWWLQNWQKFLGIWNKALVKLHLIAIRKIERNEVGRSKAKCKCLDQENVSIQAKSRSYAFLEMQYRKTHRIPPTAHRPLPTKRYICCNRTIWIHLSPWKISWHDAIVILGVACA